MCNFEHPIIPNVPASKASDEMRRAEFYLGKCDAKHRLKGGQTPTMHSRLGSLVTQVSDLSRSLVFRRCILFKVSKFWLRLDID